MEGRATLRKNELGLQKRHKGVIPCSHPSVIGQLYILFPLVQEHGAVAKKKKTILEHENNISEESAEMVDY